MIQLSKFEPGKHYDLPEEDWDDIFPSEHNVRKTDIQGTLEWNELRASIKKDWVDDDLEITPDGAIWDGQRRYLLARELVVEERIELAEKGEVPPERTLPLRVRDLTPEEQIKRSLNKNILRKDVGVHDVANSLGNLIEILDTQAAVAEFLGQSDSWVSERLAVLSTPQQKFDDKTKKVVEKKSKQPDMSKVSSGKVSTVGELLSSLGEQPKKIQKRVVENTSTLPRDQLKDLKDEVKKKVKKGDTVTPEDLEEKIEEKKEIVKRTVNRTFRLQKHLNELLKTAEGRGYIEDQHEYVNDLLSAGLTELGLIDA